jgi:archaellum component FlaC
MTIDERLDRLTERYEALAQSVELLTADVRQLTANVNRMRDMMDNLMTGFGAIAELVRRHETRLDGLEGV